MCQLRLRHERPEAWGSCGTAPAPQKVVIGVQTPNRKVAVHTSPSYLPYPEAETRRKTLLKGSYLPFELE